VLGQATTDSGSVLLTWSHTGQLGPDDWFDVRVWLTGAPAYGISNVKTTSYRIGSGFPAGDYLWTIAVIRRQPGAAMVEVSRAPTTGQFHWATNPD
jgi:hypothetical protein